jgi:hypothetical protein
MKVPKLNALCAVALIWTGCNRNVADETLSAKPGEELVTKDLNNDGHINNWIVKSTNGTPLRWIRDTNHDGKPDQWSFFKDGKAFLDEVDSDHDGKVDEIYLHVRSEDGRRIREFSFRVSDRQRNVFSEQEDTGWYDLTTTNK